VRLAAWTALVVLVLDQITKLLALGHLAPGFPVPVVDGFFSLTLVMNPGLAFGMLSSTPTAWRWIVALLSIGALAVLAMVGVRLLPIGSVDGLVIGDTFVPEFLGRGLDRSPFPPAVRAGFRRFFDTFGRYDVDREVERLDNAPFADVLKDYPAEVRRFFDGPLVLSGAIATGDAVLAAQAAGADLAYIGTRFLATPEASVPERYKDEILKASANDIIYTDLFSGVHGNYLRHSVAAAGYDPENLPKSDPSKMNFGSEGGAEKKVWRDIWSAGQGVGQIDAVIPVAEVVAKLMAEYAAARSRLAL